MGYIRGADRNAVLLFPECVEDYISDDNPVRFVDAFVESLDLEELGFVRARPAETGRPAYDPAVLLRLYVYGYLNRVRSSRMLEREAKVNVELMWLLGNARKEKISTFGLRRSRRIGKFAITRPRGVAAVLSKRGAQLTRKGGGLLVGWMNSCWKRWRAK